MKQLKVYVQANILQLPGAGNDAGQMKGCNPSCSPLCKRSRLPVRKITAIFYCQKERRFLFTGNAFSNATADSLQSPGIFVRLLTGFLCIFFFGNIYHDNFLCIFLPVFPAVFFHNRDKIFQFSREHALDIFKLARRNIFL